LSSLELTGAVDDSLRFVLRGTLLAPGTVKVALFGPTGDVRLDELTLDGAPPVVGFEDDHYYVVTSARAFTLRGQVTLGGDDLLSVPGPVVALDAHLARGRLVEGERLSGLSGTTLHFDPMTPESRSEAEHRTPKVFRLSRSLRLGKETGFVLHLVMSQAEELGPVRLPLKYGERVDEVSGAPGWTREGDDLVLPTQGRAADVTVTGTLAEGGAKDGKRSFSPDSRSAYEWWLVESDPDVQVTIEGDAKLVENSQSPIPPTLPTARTYLLQRGQRLDIDARSLRRGEVLAAVARAQSRFVALTSRGEVIGDETISYDNNGLEHLTFSPAGQPVYLSTDGHAGRILHAGSDSLEMLVPVEIGAHKLRVQTLTQSSPPLLAGVIKVPMSAYPLTTGVAEVTLGLPKDVVPVAFLGGDEPRWVFTRADAMAALLGAALACFGFRTRRTRLLGSAVAAGLWLVSSEAFVFAAGALFVTGASFLASRFLRGNALFAASAAAFLIALFAGRATLAAGIASEPSRELVVTGPAIPQPESSFPVRTPSAVEIHTGAPPVSLSMPSSERYVHTRRELVTPSRPFSPRLVYVAPQVLVGLEVAWLGLVAILVFAHRAQVAELLARVRERLSRRSDVGTVGSEELPRW
jgi:hypothetical protein